MPTVHHCGFELIPLDKWTRYLRIWTLLQVVEAILDYVWTLMLLPVSVLIAVVLKPYQRIAEIEVVNI